MKRKIESIQTTRPFSLSRQKVQLLRMTVKVVGPILQLLKKKNAIYKVESHQKERAFPYPLRNRKAKAKAKTSFL